MHQTTPLRYAVLVSIVATCGAACASAQCAGSWSDAFGSFEISDLAQAMVGYDDGGGQRIWIGTAYGCVVSGQYQSTVVFKWDGARTLAPVSNISAGGVSRLLPWNDGSGMKLYAAGSFSTAGTAVAARLARWNGTTWSTFGGGITGFAVNDLAVYDYGSGAALYAGGDFTAAGGAPARGLARWNGTSWTPIVTSMGVPTGATTASIDRLAVFDHGTGPKLYAAGRFSSINGVSAQNVARYDGFGWSALGAGLTGLASWSPAGWPPVSALVVHDDGSGPRLFVGGRFALAGSVAANGIASWDGAAWHALQSGVNGEVRDFEILPGPTGPRLVVGGHFTTAGGVNTGGFAIWNGAGFVSIGATGRTCDAMVIFDSGSGLELHAIGVVGTGIPGYTPNSAYGRELQRYDGTSWRVFQQGIDGAYPLESLATHDDGTGRALYAGGYFYSAGAVATNHVARWNGASWSAVGGGLSGRIYALASHDDGTGPTLYASEQGIGASCPPFLVKRLNGGVWSNAGLTFNCWVRDLEVIDVGTGPALYAAGSFTAIGGTPANGVALWSGATWFPLGSGVYGQTPTTGPECLAQFDDGTGPALYVGGWLAVAGGQPVAAIARWNGSSWSQVGGGLNSATGVPFVTSFAVHDDGSGPMLYAAGSFSHAGGLLPVSNLARWNGSTWSDVGGGFASTAPAWSPLIRLVSFDDGSGPRLYAGGNFETAGGVPCNGTAVWNGVAWQAVGSGLLPFGGGAATFATDFAAFDPGTGKQLFMAGDFQAVDGKRAVHVSSLRPNRPTLGLSQPGGPGTGVVIANGGMIIGANMFNVFSLDACPGPVGSGPYLGLCANDLSFLLAQVFTPSGAVPFHYTAPASSAVFGPYPVPPGLPIQGVCFDLTGGGLHCVSTIAQIVVQ